MRRILPSSGRFDHVVIVASGICEPMPIAYTVSELCKAGGESGQALVAPDDTVAVVDCARLVGEFAGGRESCAHRTHSPRPLKRKQRAFDTVS